MPLQRVSLRFPAPPASLGDHALKRMQHGQRFKPPRHSKLRFVDNPTSNTRRLAVADRFILCSSALRLL